MSQSDQTHVCSPRGGHSCRQNIADSSSLFLITGAAGFIGDKVVENLLARGFRRLRCFVRASSNLRRLRHFAALYPEIELFKGNLLSRDDCIRATTGASIIYHLAAGRGEKSFSDAYLNSVVSTRNLIEATLQTGCIRRFVNVSSFTVYSNRKKPTGRLLDESCPVEERPELRGEAYCFAKTRQEQLVIDYGQTQKLPYVTLRPGFVYGPGNETISSRVGIGTFGLFLHLGGSNQIPLSYVDNCADAIVLAGLTPDINGQVLNVVDDDLPSSRQFLRLYKKKVRSFRSIFVPKQVSYLLCALWEDYSARSQGQLPPAFNRRMWHAYWEGCEYSNAKLKSLLQWEPSIPTVEGLNRYFRSCQERGCSA